MSNPLGMSMAQLYSKAINTFTQYGVDHGLKVEPPPPPRVCF